MLECLNALLIELSRLLLVRGEREAWTKIRRRDL
jgi:hypothetical protein